MSYRFKADQSAEQNLRRIACEQIDSALEELDDRDLDTHQTVHQVRKRCKKLRGLVRLTRPRFEQTYKLENRALRQAAGRLSFARDAQAVLETFDELMRHYAAELQPESFAALREKLVQRRDERAADSDKVADKLEAFRQDMQAVRERAEHWTLDAKGYKAVAGGFKKVYKRGRRAMAKAYAKPNTERFHEWRKRVKYHRYHARLLQDLWKKPIKAYRKELHQLSDYLGDEHDLAVLAETLNGEPQRFPPSTDLEAFHTLITRRRNELRAAAEPLGRKIYSSKPKRLEKRFGDYWAAWQDQAGG